MEVKAFVRWVADHVDHNQVTLKGKGTDKEKEWVLYRRAYSK